MTDVTAHVQSRAVGPWTQPTPCTCSHKVPAVLAPVTALGSVLRLLPQHSTSRKHSFLPLPDVRTPADPAPTCSSSRAVTAQASDLADPPARPGAPTAPTPPTPLTPPTSPTPRTPLGAPTAPTTRTRRPHRATDPADSAARLLSGATPRPSGENARSAPFGTGNRSSPPAPPAPGLSRPLTRPSARLCHPRPARSRGPRGPLAYFPRRAPIPRPPSPASVRGGVSRPRPDKPSGFQNQLRLLNSVGPRPPDPTGPGIPTNPVTVAPHYGRGGKGARPWLGFPKQVRPPGTPPAPLRRPPSVSLSARLGVAPPTRTRTRAGPATARTRDPTRDGGRTAGDPPAVRGQRRER